MIENALRIKGWMSPSELQWLAGMAQKSKVIVEFGSYHGRSTRALGDNTPGKVYAVDTWSKHYPDKDGNNTNIVHDNSYTEFCKNVEDLMIREKIIPIITSSQTFELDKPVDFVFIDADHRYEAVVEDIKVALKLVKKGGIIAGHDYNHEDWPGVQRAVIHMIPKYEVYKSIWWTEI